MFFMTQFILPPHTFINLIFINLLSKVALHKYTVSLFADFLLGMLYVIITSSIIVIKCIIYLYSRSSFENDLDRHIK